MRNFLFPSAFFLFAAAVFAAPLNLTGTVKALSETGEPIENAVVLLKVNDNLIAYARTLSNEQGNFTLLPGKNAPSESITPIIRQQSVQSMNFVSYQAMDLKGRSHSHSSLPQGIYVLLGKTDKGKTVNLGTIYHKGGALKFGDIAQKEQKAKPLAKSITNDGKEVQLIVRKTGFLPKEVGISSFDEYVGVVVLERDPLEGRIDSVMALMTLDDKICQMNQALGSYGSSSCLNGSVLHGGDTYSNTILTQAYNTMLQAPRAKIPPTYGKDMVHGAAAISNATIFPHNIGLGATRDSALVRRTCEITAKESWAGNVDLLFAPAISVPQDERWGRVYEGFGETAELAAMMGAACVRGFQGDKYNEPWRVIATAKHYLADGSTTNGVDRGNNATITNEELREVHLPGYEAVVEQGVLSIMASFNQIRGVHQHVDSLRMTGWLKTELGFDGYIIGDWAGINHSVGGGYDECGYGSCVVATSIEAVEKSINAGLDMAMNESSFTSNLKTLYNNGKVGMDRIDDAVRRILRAKFRAGRMDEPDPSIVRNRVMDGYANASAFIGNSEHRKIAREAVRKSLVLLKNDNNALPISKNAKVHIFGSHINRSDYQCGGWTRGWSPIPTSISGVTTIQTAFNSVLATTTASEADVIVYVTGEVPYAEWHGDIASASGLTFGNWSNTVDGNTFADPSQATNIANLNTYKSQGKKIITVFISGRARETNALLNASDAFVAAWLPGSEGAGVTDFLFGDHEFANGSNKLPFTWPKDVSLVPLNKTMQDPNPSDKWFPYGYGLSY